MTTSVLSLTPEPNHSKGGNNTIIKILMDHLTLLSRQKKKNNNNKIK